MANKRQYYSVRAGNTTGLCLDLFRMRSTFITTYTNFNKKRYFQEALGYHCAYLDPEDSTDFELGVGPEIGVMGIDPESYAMVKLRKTGLFPIRTDAEYSEGDIFDLIEFLYDHVSKPKAICECGWHYDAFDRATGRREFREEVNEFLALYQGGWELSPDGEIRSLANPGLGDLLTQELPSDTESDVKTRVESAVRRFRRYKSSDEERHNAVRDLADVLEHLRPDAKKVLTNSDESDLFNIANNFGIRHNRTNQKTNYDHDIWLPWVFYHYLATIHTILRLIERGKEGTNKHALSQG